jgi:hypothetical protein
VNACVGRGHRGRERVETSVFKSMEQSVLGWSNFEIRALGSILLFYKKKDL